jgi:hypothetical protein
VKHATIAVSSRSVWYNLGCPMEQGKTLDHSAQQANSRG